jgi:hypothetical protein
VKSHFCAACSGAGQTTTSWIDGSGGYLRTCTRTTACAACDGRRGVGPAFAGDAVPTDQRALDLINERLSA